MNEQEFLSFTEKLFSLQSHTPVTSLVPHFLIETLKRYGANPQIIESEGIKNIICQTSQQNIIILNGHWDTVLPNESFRTATIATTHTASQIKGLGACDMKSGVAAMVAAFIDCLKSNIPGVTLCLVGDEELGGKNGTQKLVEDGYTGKYVILGEPTNLSVSLGQKGGLFLTAKAKGISGHSAYPQRGENAINKLINFINKMNVVFPTPPKSTTTDQIFNMTTLSFNVITGGSSTNVIPDYCETKADIRIPPTVSEIEVQKQINQLATECGVEIEANFLGKGWQLDKASDLFETAKVVVQSVLNKDPEFIQKMGTNDGKYYAKHGSQIINIGPGNSKLSHTLDEVVVIDQLNNARKIYFQMCQAVNNNK